MVTWKHFDESGVVFGIPKEVELAIVVRSSITYIVDTKTVMSILRSWGVIALLISECR